MKYFVFISLIAIFVGCNSVPTEHIAVVKNYVAAVEALDYETMDELLAEDYVGYGPSVGHSINKEEALLQWAEISVNLYEKISYNRTQYGSVTITDGEHDGEWITTWAELTIVYQDGLGEVTIMANSNYQVKNGKISMSYTFYNEADVLEQLGFVFINPDNY